MNESDKPTSTDKIYLEHARTDEQRADMENIARRDICFMCAENIPEFYEARGGLVEEGEYSYLVRNGYPYENTEWHLMAIPKQHVEHLSDLSDGFILEAFGYFRKLERDLEITGGAVAMRFGNPAETGATAHHFHIHFIVPSKQIGPDDEPVRFRMSPKFPNR